jgi:hypothetical protein
MHVPALLVGSSPLISTKRLPALASIKGFVDTVNSPGGHILILSLFSIYFFKVAVQLFYQIMFLPDETISKHDAIITAGITFVTGTAFGAAWSALLTSMTGKGGNIQNPPVATGLSIEQVDKGKEGK